MHVPHDVAVFGLPALALPDSPNRGAARSLGVRAMTKTSRHDLQLVRGRMRVTVTETPERVYVAFDGAKPRGCERWKVARFTWPIVLTFNMDPRPLEISGCHADYTGHVFGTGDNAICITVPNAVRAKQ
jgi:hypothetical protein